MNLIKHKPNIYVNNNNKFISIVDNVSIFQLSLGPRGPFYTVENLPQS